MFIRNRLLTVSTKHGMVALSNDNLRDKKVIRDVNMSKLNNEDVIEVACVFGEEIRCSDCHWI
jgi:hypothetical protein